MLVSPRALAAGVAVAAVAGGSVAAGAVGQPKVKAPASGSHYSGTSGKKRAIDIYVSGKSIEIVAFDFPCGQVTGRTSLNGINLKKWKKGYHFALSAHGGVTYSDEHPDENAKVAISGRFSKTAKSAQGRLRVNSPRCHDTGSVNWSVFLKRH